MDLEIALEESGLSEKEIKVYLALLPLGNVKLQEIARHLEFPRTTVYNTVNHLIEKGLVSKIIKKGIAYFEATSPKRLLEKIEERKKIVQSVLPQLEELKSTLKETSSVEIYEGVKGISTILSDVFKVRQQVHSFGSYLLAVKFLKHLPLHARNLRLERRIPTKYVFEPCDEPDFHRKEYKQITEMRFLSSLKDFPCIVFIYGKNVALYTLKGDLIGIIIKNEQVAAAMKIVFDTFWNIAQKKI